MKRAWITGLIMIFAVNSFSGCGDSESVSASAQSEITVTPTPTTEVSPTPETEDEIEVTLAEGQELLADYTTMQDLTVEPGTYIAVVVKGLDSAYWSQVKKGAQAAIAELNNALGYKGEDKVRITFEGPGDEMDVDSQINTLDAVLADNPTVLCLAAIDMQSCDAQLETAAENGIPVLVLDSGVQSDLVQVSCGTNNYAAGTEAAKRLCEAIGDSGEVAVIAHQKTSKSSMDRVSGFTDEITQNHPNVSLVQVSYEDEEESVENMVKNTLGSSSNLAGYFATNENMSEELLAALKSVENATVKVVGFDAGDTQIKAIKDGTEIGIIVQNPYSMGYVTMVAAARMSAGLEVDSYIDTGYQWNNMDNIELLSSGR